MILTIKIPSIFYLTIYFSYQGVSNGGHIATPTIIKNIISVHLISKSNV